MNRFLEAGAVTKYERQILNSLIVDGVADSAALLTALQAFDVTLQTDRLKQVLTNVQQTCALSQAHATIINDALAAL